MTTESFALRAKLARRLPDPVFGKSEGLEHYLFLANTRDLPRDLPLEANARRPNTRKQIYREVRESLLDQDGESGSFHLKNKGIVIVANSVAQKRGSSDEYDIQLDRTNQGILDGGHTYQLIMDAQQAGELPEEQYVFVTVRTGIPLDWIPQISRGLNTSVQVQDMSLDNLAGRFSWIKETLKGESYIGEIAWSENDPGEFTVRDIIALLYVLNVKLFPGGDSHPIAGYEKKSDALKAFENNPGTFESMKPILKDVLRLHDLIAFEAPSLYNRGAAKLGLKGRGGGLSFVKQAKRKAFEPIFSAGEDPQDTRLEDAALFPILAAFRVFVQVDKRTGKMSWQDGFESVRTAWRELAYELMKATLHTAQEVGRQKNAIGKSRLHWDGIYQKVENYKLRQLSGS